MDFKGKNVDARNVLVRYLGLVSPRSDDGFPCYRLTLRTTDIRFVFIQEQHQKLYAFDPVDGGYQADLASGASHFNPDLNAYFSTWLGEEFPEHHWADSRCKSVMKLQALDAAIEVEGDQMKFVDLKNSSLERRRWVESKPC